MKKILSLTLALICLFALAVPAFAQTVYIEGALNYTIENKQVTITNYFGNDAEVTVPDEIAGLEVVKIASGAFKSGSCKTVYIPSTAVVVENGAIADGIKVVYPDESVSNDTTATWETNAVETSQTGNVVTDYYGNVVTDESGNAVTETQKTPEQVVDPDFPLQGGVVNETDANGNVIAQEVVDVVDPFDTAEDVSGVVTDKDGNVAENDVDETPAANNVAKTVITIACCVLLVVLIALVVFFAIKKRRNK